MVAKTRDIDGDVLSDRPRRSAEFKVRGWDNEYATIDEDPSMHESQPVQEVLLLEQYQRVEEMCANPSW